MIIALFGAILPFILWPIEKILPFPYIIEEIAFGILIYFILKSTKQQNLRITYALLAGFLFTITEAILYLFNFIYVGNSQIFLQRLLLTTPLHMGTIFIILIFGMKKKELIPLGIILAAIIHYTFNIFVGKI